MLVTRIRQSVIAAVVVAATVAGTTGLFGATASATLADPDSGASNAYGAAVTLFGGALLGPLPSVVLGPDGQDAGPGQVLPLDIPGFLTANTVNVTASSTNFGLPTEQISAQAGTEGLSTLNGISLLNTLLDVNAVNVECNSNAAGSTGATQIVGLSIGGAAPVNIPSPIPPNTGLTASELGPLAGLVTITLNKQTVVDRNSPGSTLDGTSIDVIGLQITLLSALNTGAVINVSHTFCQATGGDIEAVPSVTSVTPNVGPVAGGTPVIIMGSGFTPTSSVQFGGRTASDIVYVNSTEMTAGTPAAANQTANSTVGVEVSNTYGFGPTPNGPANDFTYEVVPSSPLKIVPTSGPTTGGQNFTLTGPVTGANFGPDSVVAFGTNASGIADATHVVVSPDGNTITGVTPAHIAGLVDVTVGDAGGVATLDNGYTYINAPIAVTNVHPNAGPIAGGTIVTITGVGFTGTTCPTSGVTFGGTPATTCAVNSDTQITATSPAHARGHGRCDRDQHELEREPGLAGQQLRSGAGRVHLRDRSRDRHQRDRPECRAGGR